MGGRSFFGFRKREPPLLTVEVNGRELCTIRRDSLPREVNPTERIDPGSAVVFSDAAGGVHRHDLGMTAGWGHFSIRVHETFVCQADCVITDARSFDPEAFARGDATGIRFEPFFLPGAAVQSGELAGKGLFHRGLHFNGTVTPGNVILSCECDACRRSFLVRSFHAGFGQVSYFYSGSGKHTLLVDARVPGAPAALSEPDPETLAALERRLPPAPDGTSFRYLNPFRCPHCTAPYIDFEAHPEMRPGEYYGNHFPGSKPIRFDVDGGSPEASGAGKARGGPGSKP